MTFPTRGPAKEVFGMHLELLNPRARLSRSQSRGKFFSALGELLWYLSGSDDADHIAFYVDYYSDPKWSIEGRVTGAYGPRLFDFDGKNQIEFVIELLRTNRETRNAVIQIFDHDDSENAPCTLALQFAVRGGALHTMVSMRSNDVFLGLSHDIFAFTMIQELIAQTLGLELGAYHHSVGSLHLYENKTAKTDRYLKEGWHDSTPMPAIPEGDPWAAVRNLLELEDRIRSSHQLQLHDLNLPQEAYWLDLSLMLFAFKLDKEGRMDEVDEIRKMVDNEYYKTILKDRIRIMKKRKKK